ncbi:hypothetical protein C8F01DRAFT_1250560 [Mycena amicta]|nr:hypothetical protein C8F01DRAFT_1250560 [Mycena amicta]
MPAHRSPDLRTFELPNVFTKRRRSIIACTNCRKRKTRCFSTEEFPENPCERCAEKGLKCRYTTIGEQRARVDAASTGDSSDSSPPATPPLLLLPNPQLQFSSTWDDQAYTQPACSHSASYYLDLPSQSRYLPLKYSDRHGYSGTAHHLGTPLPGDTDPLPITRLRPWQQDADVHDPYFTHSWNIAEIELECGDCSDSSQ